MVLLDAHLNNHSDVVTKASHPSSIDKHRQFLSKGNDALAITMEISKKKPTIEVMVNGEERKKNATKKFWPLKLKNMKII